jgi:hypothetical protein
LKVVYPTTRLSLVSGYCAVDDVNGSGGLGLTEAQVENAASAADTGEHIIADGAVGDVTIPEWL